MKYVVLVLLAAALLGCASGVDRRVERDELSLQGAEQALVTAEATGDPLMISAARAAVEAARERLARSEEAAQDERAARQAFWLAVISFGGVAIKALGGLAAKGAAIIA